jgi:hypothetical protein
MKDDEKFLWKDYNKLINFDYMSLYADIRLDTESMIREINKKRLNENRKEKLERLNSL